MCGCMLMHAGMGHAGHDGNTAARPAEAVAAGGICAHCGYPLRAGFSFCPDCGMSLDTSECKACGRKVEPGWKACAYCGSPLTGTS